MHLSTFLGEIGHYFQCDTFSSVLLYFKFFFVEIKAKISPHNFFLDRSFVKNRSNLHALCTYTFLVKLVVYLFLK